MAKIREEFENAFYKTIEDRCKEPMLSNKFDNSSKGYALWSAKWMADRCAKELYYQCSCADEDTHNKNHECRIRGQMAEWILELAKELSNES